MPIYCGNKKLIGAALGAIPIIAIYAGATKVWPEDSGKPGVVEVTEYEIKPGTDGWISRNAVIGLNAPFDGIEAFGRVIGDNYWGSDRPDRLAIFSFKVIDSFTRRPLPPDEVTMQLGSLFQDKWGDVDQITIKSGSLETVLGWGYPKYPRNVKFKGTYSNYISGSKPSEWAAIAQAALDSGGTFKFEVHSPVVNRFEEPLLKYTLHDTYNFSYKSSSYGGIYGDNYGSKITPNAWQPSGKFEHVGWVANGGALAVKSYARDSARWKNQEIISLRIDGKEYPMFYNANVSNGSRYTAGFENRGVEAKEYLEAHKSQNGTFSISSVSIEDDSPMVIVLKLYQRQSMKLADGTLVGFQTNMSGTNSSSPERMASVRTFGSKGALLGRIGYLKSAGKFIVESQTNESWSGFRELSVYVGINHIKLGWNETTKRYEDYIDGDSHAAMGQLFTGLANDNSGAVVRLVPGGAQDVS